MITMLEPVVIDLTIAPPIVDIELKALIPPLNPEEYEGLENSLIKEGCREPITTWNNIIIDGHNRMDICNKHNIPYKTKEMRFNSKDDVKIWMIDNQLSRRNLDKWDRLKLAEVRRPLIEAKAKENQINAGGAVPQKSAGAVDTRKEVAAIVGVSHDTYTKMTTISQKKPEMITDIKLGKTSINKAYSDIKLAERLEQIKSIPQPPPMPNGKFNVIYADPPWQYVFSKLNRDSIDSHYPTLSIDDICKLNIPVEDNAVLLLWATAPLLKDALQVMDAWGFEYKTNAIWDKGSIGLGYWFRGQHELLLVGVKGTFKVPDPTNRYSSVIRVNKTEHSKKPIIVYDMIEKMFPEQKYLELFARDTRPRWSVWGNQI